MEGGGEGEERGLRGLIDGGWERGGVYRMASFVHYMGWLHLYTTMSGGKHYNTIAVSINIYVSFPPPSSLGNEVHISTPIVRRRVQLVQ